LKDGPCGLFVLRVKIGKTFKLQYLSYLSWFRDWKLQRNIHSRHLSRHFRVICLDAARGKHNSTHNLRRRENPSWLSISGQPIAFASLRIGHFSAFLSRMIFQVKISARNRSPHCLKVFRNSIAFPISKSFAESPAFTAQMNMRHKFSAVSLEYC